MEVKLGLIVEAELKNPKPERAKIDCGRLFKLHLKMELAKDT